MTPILTGGVKHAEDAGLQFAHSPGDESLLKLRYLPAEPGPGSYQVPFAPVRVSVAVRRTERGWIASAAELTALGYAETQEAAVDDLLDVVEEYLKFLRDDAPSLAPTVAHHAAYVVLLAAPRSTWLASVSVDASPVE